MFKIALTAGHYRYTPGKRCSKALDPNETREWVLNARICDKVEALLQNYDGYELLRTDDRTGETDVTLRQRTNKANAFGADVYISVHHNGGINGGAGGGVEAYTYTKVDAETAAWQKALYDAIIAKTGLRGNRANPLAKKDLHECRETAMPAILLECGFMDSATDVPVILTEAFADNVAAAIVEVLVARGGLTAKTPLSGDVNGDGVVNTTDARMALQAAVGKAGLTAAQAAAADVDGDGTVTTTDAREILQQAVGKK